ncbi:DUF3397 domain-containing protein [Salimicrobium halophilum]|uniref:DUF3397 domain-containing protein n=1 Tax=Salimicrobium halophilum TaxID=86666 RepID=A0A1G8QGP1_9BACI|nr:DUF3397 domain-containing protein [Salimicrobium halophilum]SDJ03753.1 Protein of unknown function [Salimicrobium halophilum]
MINVFTFIVAPIVTMPLLFFLFIYIWFQKWTKTKKRALRGAVHLTAPIFVVDVYLLLEVLFGSGYIGWVVVMLLCLMGLSCVIQYKTREELKFGRTFKGFLRLAFLVFTFAHVSLFSYGFVTHVFLAS